MPTQRKRCAQCAEKERRFNEGWRTILTASGAVDLQLPSTFTYGTMVFDSPARGEPRRLGDVIPYVLRAVVDGAPYFSAAHRPWLAALLHDMLEATPQTYANSEGLRMVDVPVEQAGLALRAWFWATGSRARAGSVLPQFALAAARFVEDHLWGGFGMRFRLEGALRGRNEPHRICGDSGERARFTRQWCPQRVRAVIPPGSKLKVQDRWNRWEREVLAGSVIEFEVERCFDSSGIRDQGDVVVLRPKREYDLLDGFLGYGTVYGEFAKDGELKLKGEIPFEWVTEEYVRTEPVDSPKRWEDCHTWEPLPAWLRPAPEPVIGGDGLTHVHGSAQKA